MTAGSIAQSVTNSNSNSVTFVETDHEITPTVGLSLSLVQGKQQSITGKMMCASGGKAL